MAEQLANNAAGTLNASILVGDTSLTLTAGQGTTFPSIGSFRILIGTELIIATARSGDVLTLGTRGAEGTTAAGHTAGDAVTHILTAGGLLQYLLDNDTVTYVTSSDQLIPANEQRIVADVYEIGSGSVTELASSALLAVV